MAVAISLFNASLLFILTFSLSHISGRKPQWPAGMTEFPIIPGRPLKIFSPCVEAADTLQEFDWPEFTASSISRRVNTSAYIPSSTSSRGPSSVLLKRLRTPGSPSGEIPNFLSTDGPLDSFMPKKSIIFTSSCCFGMSSTAVLIIALIAVIVFLCLVHTILSAIRLGKSLKLAPKCHCPTVQSHSSNKNANETKPAILRV